MDDDEVKTIETYLLSFNLHDVTAWEVLKTSQYGHSFNKGVLLRLFVVHCIKRH